MPVRCFGIVVLTFWVGACSSVHVEHLDRNAYTLSRSTDTISFFSAKHDIVDKADDVCPNGWVRLSSDEEPSDLRWTVACGRVAAATVAAPPPKPVPPPPESEGAPVVAPPPPEPAPSAPGAATAPPTKL